MAKATLTVTLADMPQVKAMVERLENEADDLRHLLQQWEPRVTCPQCGERYIDSACGPSHAVVQAMVTLPGRRAPVGDLDGRVSALSPTEMMRLDLWASTFVDAFDHGPWLVGSVLQRRDFRDVDVRLVLDDDDPLLADPDRLRLLNVGLSVWAQQMTGLPVDFQFQPGSEWAKHTEAGHRRNPLGHRWRTVHRAPLTGRSGDDQ